MDPRLQTHLSEKLFMKLSLTKLILTALAVMTVNTLISCAPKGGAGSSGPGFGEAKGTQDSGGGTGVDGKVYESYIVDPTTLPAFKNYIVPIFKNMKSDDDADNQGGVLIASLKTWYVAPVELNKISKDLLGVSFVKTSTQQIARQTTKEIWIDKTIFDKMSEQDQAELIIHEMVETMYFYKFIGVREFCGKAVANHGKNSAEDCVRFSDAFDQAMPPEIAHPLDEQDNANIRAVTGWLKTHGGQAFTESDFNEFCLSRGFDKRFFSHNANSKEKLKEIKISYNEFYAALHGAQISGQMPEVCTAQTLNKSESCKTTVTETKIELSLIQLPGISLDVVGASGSTNITFFQNGDATLVPQADGNGGYVYLYYAGIFRAKNKVGDRAATTILMFRKDETVSQNAYLLESIYIKNGMIIGIDKTKAPFCTVTTVNATSVYNDAIYIHKPGVKMNLAEQMNKMVPPMAMCSADNVE